MNRLGISLSCLAGVLLLQTPVLAIEAENPYPSIIERNAFALKERPAPPPVEPPAPAEPPPNIQFNALTILNHQKQVYISLLNPKAPNAPPQYISLKEGQKSGGVEVLEIREKTGEVRILNSGKE